MSLYTAARIFLPWSRWSERKEQLELLLPVIDTPKIAAGDYAELVKVKHCTTIRVRVSIAQPPLCSTLVQHQYSICSMSVHCSANPNPNPAVWLLGSLQCSVCGSQVLDKYVMDSNINVSASAVNCVGKLAAGMGTEFIPYIKVQHHSLYSWAGLQRTHHSLYSWAGLQRTHHSLYSWAGHALYSLRWAAGHHWTRTR